ncbi:MAG: ester cyclase [Dehalococcoidia bacterium]|nr:ester cyclase [Dehalococcoidia bacterium]
MAAQFSVEKQTEALNQHDPDAFAGFYRPDAVVYDPQHPEPLKGRDAIRKDIGEFLAAFPDLNFALKTVVTSGDTVAFEGAGTGTHKGPLAGPTGAIPATNRTAEIRFAAFLRVDDQGLIAEERRYFDMAGMMQQLGIMPA